MIGTQELIVILILALFLFGPKKLPELARSLGSAVGEFKKAQRASELELNQFDAYTQKAANIVASEEKEKEKEQKDNPEKKEQKDNPESGKETKINTDSKAGTNLENMPEAGKSIPEKEELQKS